MQLISPFLHAHAFGIGAVHGGPGVHIHLDEIDSASSASFDKATIHNEALPEHSISMTSGVSEKSGLSLTGGARSGPGHSVAACRTGCGATSTVSRRQRRRRRHLHPLRHRLGDGAVRGHGRLRHDLGLDEVDGPRARGIGAGDGRLQAAHHAHHHPAHGDAGRAGRHAVRVRRNARFVRRRAGARHSRPHLRHHHGNLGFNARLST
mgnify:CR=1 FL=1